jgi:hypothetical protein
MKEINALGVSLAVFNCLGFRRSIGSRVIRIARSAAEPFKVVCTSAPVLRGSAKRLSEKRNAQ